MNVDKQIITAILEGLTVEQIRQIRDIVMSMYFENEEAQMVIENRVGGGD